MKAYFSKHRLHCMLINILIISPFLLTLPQEQLELENTLYPLKTLNSLIGDPDHPYNALSPDKKVELLVEDNGDVILRDLKDNSEKELANTDGREGWHGTGSWAWSTSDRVASFLNDGNVFFPIKSSEPKLYEESG